MECRRGRPGTIIHSCMDASRFPGWLSITRLRCCANGSRGNIQCAVGLEIGNDAVSSKKKMAPKVGLEPTTDRLTADCSTIELLWNPKGAWNVRLPFGTVKHRAREISSNLRIWRERRIIRDDVPRLTQQLYRGAGTMQGTDVHVRLLRPNAKCFFSVRHLVRERFTMR